jgi:hypothetical protein
MTEFFHYDNLTWPEVAELPRDVPLVLPLGSSFDSEKVAAQLGNPQRLGILPSFPIGWRGRIAGGIAGLKPPAQYVQVLRTAGATSRIYPTSMI